MIIDMILDRRDTEEYNPREFYHDVMRYESVFGLDRDISLAMDYGEEADVRRALCDYIIRNEYNPQICEYINSRNWLG